MAHALFIELLAALRVARDEGEWKETGEYRRFEELIGASNISFLESYDAWSGRIELNDVPGGS